MQSVQSKQSSALSFRALRLGLFLGIILIPLALFSGCSKQKKDPNLNYDQQTGDSSGKGSVDESDLGGDAARAAGRAGTGSMAGMQTVYFDFDSANLSPEARKGIEENANYLKSNGKLKVTIEGHCDNRGSTEYNLALGERRANAVRDFMANMGIPRNRLKTISYGEERPSVNGENEAAWGKNRRAEFVQNK